MTILCDCGTFKANLTSFPKNTPGRLVCYCKDCQKFLKKIGREDLLDRYGGTEVIPAFPKDVKILEGQDSLICYRLTPRGLYRWATACCNSPIVNMRPDFPWAGIFHSAYTSHDPNSLSILGEIKSRIYGRDAVQGAPYKISHEIGFRDLLVIMPFIIKGKIMKMNQGSPFFKSDNSTPVCVPIILDENDTRIV